MNDIDKIILACHKVLALDTIFNKSKSINISNIAFVYILKQLGYFDIFIEKNTFSPLNINEIYEILIKTYKKVDINQCINNLGSGIYVAIDNNIKNWNICIIYPTDSIYSNRWQINVPYVANFNKNVCITSLDKAFDNKPELFLIGKPC